MNLLLIGDSIRMFYSSCLKKELGQDYNVFEPEENCRFAAYTLNSLRHWLPNFPTPDIIHWNNGLWDTAVIYKEDGCFTPIDVYLDNMQKILRELKKTGAKIIFATSTPVSDKKKFLPGPMPPAGFNEDIMRYNDAVVNAFANEGVIINDLFSLIYEDREKYISDDMIHPNEEGRIVLTKAVADAVRSCGRIKNIHNFDMQHIHYDEKTIQ